MNSLMGSFMGMPGMNMGVNPFVQFLNQSGIHPNWSGLSGICKKYSCQKNILRDKFILFVILL